MEKTDKSDKNGTDVQNISELYRVALAHFFDMHTMETLKKDVFKDLNETYENVFFRELKNFINKKGRLSEKKRIQIASFLGFKYEEFIALGRKLVDLEKEDMSPEHKGSEALSLNLSTVKTFQEIQRRHDLSDRDVAKCLNMDLMDYMFRQRGLIPFSFEEISLIFEIIGKKSPDSDDSQTEGM
jgi:hypothetical protein